MPVPARVTRSEPPDIPASLDVYGGYGDAAEAAPRRGRSLTPEALLRYKWTIVLVALSVLIVSQAAVWTLITPMYRASALIEIQPIIQKLISTGDEFSPVPYYGQYLATQVDVVKSNDVLDKVLDEPIVQSTRWYKNPKSSPLDRFRTPTPPLDRLKDELVVVVPRDKQVLEVSMSCVYPQEAKIIVDVAVEKYAENVSSARFLQDNKKIIELDNLKKEYGEKITDLEVQLRAMQQQPELRTPDPKGLVNSRSQDLESLRAKADELALECLIIEDLLKQHGAAATQGEAGAATAHGSEFASDPRWRVINENIEKVESELSQYRLSLGELHPTVKAAVAQLNLLKKKREEQEALLTQAGPALRSNVGQNVEEGEIRVNDPRLWRVQLLEYQTRLKQTRKEIEERTGTYSVAFERLGEFEKKQADLIKTQKELEEVEASLRDIQQQRRMPANIRLLGKAFEPAGPSEDKRPKMALASLFGSIAAGLAVAFLRYQLNPKIIDVRDVTVTAGGGRLLGHLPLLSSEKPFEHTIVAYQQESVRSIRTALMPRFTAGVGQVLQITSAGPGTGKTTFALMLAESLASCGKRVLLVDADFRRSSLSRRLGCGEAPGLFDLLQNEGLKQEHVAVRRPPGVVVIPAGGGHDSQASELLANGVLGRRIREWRQSFDAVLIDSSPIVPIADGSMLAQQVDGSIVLVREGHCDRRGVADAIAQITAVGGQPLGVVFVGERAHHSYSYYGRDESLASA